MKKYGVDRTDEFCEECGEKLTRVNGKLSCLACEQAEKYGTETKVKTKQESKKARWT